MIAISTHQQHYAETGYRSISQRNCFIEQYCANEIPQQQLEGVAAIFVECFTGFPRYESWDIPTVKEMIKATMGAGSLCSIAVEAGGNVMGFALGMSAKFSKIYQDLKTFGIMENDYYLDQLAIRPQAQGLGLGKQLLRHQIDTARSNYSRIAVRCRSDVEPIQRLLANEDFRVIAKYFADTAGSGMAERLILQKNLLRLA